MCTKLVFWKIYTMMHGQKNIKLCNAVQAKWVYQYKNIKLELYKNNAAIWYNKIASVN